MEDTFNRLSSNTKLSEDKEEEINHFMNEKKSQQTEEDL